MMNEGVVLMFAIRYLSRQDIPDPTPSERKALLPSRNWSPSNGSLGPMLLIYRIFCGTADLVRTRREM